MIPVNINEQILVKLNERGQQILKNYYQKFNLDDEQLKFSIETNSEGFYQTELWNFCAIFGPYFNVGGDNISENNEIFFNDSILKED